MCSKKWWMTMLLWGGWFVTAAAQDSDSINLAAQDPDFIHSSLVIIGPGDDEITGFGHAAIRMQCPSKELDYCFTFEMQSTNIQWDLIRGTIPSGFMAGKTAVFLSQYDGTGRGITEYDLNLTPAEKQELWRQLDRELMKKMHWNYDFITVNCGSMCAWMIESILQGEHIVYHDVPAELAGTNTQAMHYATKYAPWTELMFNLKHWSIRQEHGDFNDRLGPLFLEQVWQKATLEDGEGHSRPLLLNKRVLTPQTLQPTRPWFTPLVALALLIGVIVLLVVYRGVIRKRKRSTKS